MKRTSVWLLVLFFGVIYFPLFYKLDAIPIRTWDEGLFSLRAYYMAETGHYLWNFNELEYFDDHRNTKPPLVTWLQVAFMKVIGKHVLAMRLPVAILILKMIVIILLFFRRNFGSLLPGVFSALVLVSSTGFIKYHVARTGDHDGPLAVFMFFTLVFFYQYITSEKRRQQIQFLGLFFGSLVAAFLTKHLLGLLFLPGLFIFLLWNKKLGKVLKDKWLYIYSALSVTVVALVFVPLELRYPGFFERLWSHEGFGRFTSTDYYHDHPFYFYPKLWWEGHFWPWILLLPLSFTMLFAPAFQRFHKLLQLLWSCLIPFLLVLMASSTKLFWYDAALYPLMSVLAGVSLFAVFDFLRKKAIPGTPFPRLALYVYFFGGIFLYPYGKVIDQINRMPEVLQSIDRYAYLMEDLEKHHPQIKEYTILTTEDYGAHAGFYRLLYEEKGYEIDIRRNYELAAGTKTLICLDGPQREVKKRFRYRQIAEKRGCVLLQIEGPKD